MSNASHSGNGKRPKRGPASGTLDHLLYAAVLDCYGVALKPGYGRIGISAHRVGYVRRRYPREWKRIHRLVRRALFAADPEEFPAEGPPASLPRRRRLAVAAVLVRLGLTKTEAARVIGVQQKYLMKLGAPEEEYWGAAVKRAKDTARQVRQTIAILAEASTDGEKAWPAMRRAAAIVRTRQLFACAITFIDEGDTLSEAGRKLGVALNQLRNKYPDLWRAEWRKAGMPDVSGPEFRHVLPHVAIRLARGALIVESGASIRDASRRLGDHQATLGSAAIRYPDLWNLLRQKARRLLRLPPGTVQRGRLIDNATGKAVPIRRVNLISSITSRHGTEPPVSRPGDLAAYVPASKLWPEIGGYKRFKTILKNHPEIHTEKRGLKRLWVHAGDWLNYRSKQDSASFDAFGRDPELGGAFLQEAKRRQAELRRGKAAKHGADSQLY